MNRFFLMMVFSVLSFGLICCGRADTNERAKASTPVPQTYRTPNNPYTASTPEVSPTPTVEIKESPEELKELQGYYAELTGDNKDKDDSPKWKKEIETKSKVSLCNLYKRADTAIDLTTGLKDNPNIQPSDVASELTQAKVQELQLKEVKAFVTKVRALNPKSTLEECEDVSIVNYAEAYETVVVLLEGANLEPKDVGLTAAQIRSQILAGYATLAKTWKVSQKPDGDDSEEVPNSKDILDAIDKYGFTAQQLGLTNDDLKKMKDE